MVENELKDKSRIIYENDEFISVKTPCNQKAEIGAGTIKINIKYSNNNYT
jgi:hypothetical protein